MLIFYKKQYICGMHGPAWRTECEFFSLFKNVQFQIREPTFQTNFSITIVGKHRKSAKL